MADGCPTRPPLQSGQERGELSPLPWWPEQPVPPLAWATGDQGTPALLLLDRRAAGAADTIGTLISLLDRGEQDRAQRFRRPDDRDRYQLGRAALRQVLGAWLDRDPAALRFRYGPHGKPALDGVEDAAPHFNVSHSGDLILLGFHAAAPVGIDVERQQAGLDWLPIARRCLDPAQVESLLALPPAQAASAFVELWCALEAGLKARGVGLAQASQAQSLAIEPRLRRWRLALPPGYGGAVALLQPT